MEQLQRYKKFSGLTTQAYDLIEKLKFYKFKIEPPINIEGIIRFLGLKYEIKPDFNNMKTTGNIKIKEGIPTIWVNPIKNALEERKRFTLAHELGHLMLHIAPLGDLNNFKAISDINISFNRDENWSYVEMEANDFASQLLMPVNFINAKVNDIISENSEISEKVLIEKLAEYFKVSKTAMENRLRKLGVAL